MQDLDGSAGVRRGDGDPRPLRGGQLESARSMRLYAGCGIVGASDPQTELDEADNKLLVMKSALGGQY